MILPTWLVDLITKIDQSDNFVCKHIEDYFNGRIDNLGIARLFDLICCLIDKVEDAQNLLNKALDRVAQSSVELSRANQQLKRADAEIDRLKALRAKEDAELEIDIDRIMANLPPLKPGRCSTAMKQLRTMTGKESGPIGDVLSAAVTEIEQLKDLLALTVGRNEQTLGYLLREAKSALADSEARNATSLEVIAAREQHIESQRVEIERLTLEHDEAREAARYLWRGYFFCESEDYQRIVAKWPWLQDGK